VGQIKKQFHFLRTAEINRRWLRQAGSSYSVKSNCTGLSQSKTKRFIGSFTHSNLRTDRRSRNGIIDMNFSNPTFS